LRAVPSAAKIATTTSATNHQGISVLFGVIRNPTPVPTTNVKQPPAAGPFSITPGYRMAAQALAAKQVALAGARLANLLNASLK
jgi:hypothetical protein